MKISSVKSFVAVDIAMLFAFLTAPQVFAQNVVPANLSPTTYSWGTNTFIGGGAPGGSTNFAPYSWISGTNVNATNWGSYITNTFSGWIDLTRQSSFCFQTGCAVAAGPGTNITPITFCFEPSLDGLNPNSFTDHSFWFTNQVTGTGSASGLTNSALSSTNFANAVSYGYGWMFLAAIINPNTNGFYGAITNAGTTNMSAISLSTNNAALIVGQKKVVF